MITDTALIEARPPQRGYSSLWPQSLILPKDMNSLVNDLTCYDTSLQPGDRRGAACDEGGFLAVAGYFVFRSKPCDRSSSVSIRRDFCAWILIFSYACFYISLYRHCTGNTTEWLRPLLGQELFLWFISDSNCMPWLHELHGGRILSLLPY